MFFQAVSVVWPIWAHISTAKAAAQESQLWDSHQLAGSEMVLNRDCAVSEGEAAKLFVATSFPKAIQVCVGEALLF